MLYLATFVGCGRWHKSLRLALHQPMQSEGCPAHFSEVLPRPSQKGSQISGFWATKAPLVPVPTLLELRSGFGGQNPEALQFLLAGALSVRCLAASLKSLNIIRLWLWLVLFDCSLGWIFDGSLVGLTCSLVCLIFLIFLFWCLFDRFSSVFLFVLWSVCLFFAYWFAFLRQIWQICYSLWRRRPCSETQAALRPSSPLGKTGVERRASSGW